LYPYGYGPYYTEAYDWRWNPCYMRNDRLGHIHVPFLATNPSMQRSYHYPASRASHRQLQHIESIGGREGARIYRLKDAVIFKADMDIDLDGDPAAYHPNPNKAKLPFNQHGIAKDRQGRLCPVQTQGPHKGYWPSGTSLFDKKYWLDNPCDPNAYVNPEVYPYFVLPHPYYKDPKWGPVKIGDLGVVVNTLNGKMAYAIFADAYTGKYIGEGSVELARELGINPHSTEDKEDYKGGEQTKSIIYIIFPNSGQGQGTIPPLEQIRQVASQYFEAWGGMQQVHDVQNEL